MKPTIILLIIICLLSGCGVFKPAYKCTPSKHSKDYAFVTQIHAESYSTYVRARHFRAEYHTFFKCLPDSIKIGSKVSVIGWERI